MDEHPIWFDGKKINEVLLCEEFFREHPMLCIHDTFFTTEGRVSDETMLKKEILDRIKPYITSGVARRATNLLDALPQTNHIKAIFTAELPMDLEKRGRQSYQGQLYVRFIGLGNGTLHSLYDRSVGFFQRQIILTAKERPAGRVDDPFIGEKMCGEAEGIFL